MAVAFPAPQAARGSALGVLRFITCGSVDDGKSTLIGRLLHDTGQIAEDQLATLHADSGRYGTTGSEPDLALLVDGLESEREQGITIDVAHRYFDTPRRKFILADTPGHEQYTRNMATGASGADLAILLVDASKGVQVQTRRHARIVALLGVRHLVVAVNKMDLVGYQPSVFQRIVEECEGFLSQLPGTVRSFVPLSALSGCNVVCRGAALGWYTGPTLLELLESVDVQGGLQEGDLRLPVQYVNRPHAGFRGYAGTVAAGRIAVGDAVIALPGRSASRVQSIVTFDGPRREAVAGMSITITLEDDIDVGRGFVFAHPGRTPVMAREFEAHVVWMGDTPLLPGRQYDLKFAHRYVRGTVARIEHRVDVQTYETLSATELALNDVALCRFVTTEPVAIDPYEVEKTTGSLIVIDPLTHATVGAALIRRPVGTASVNLSWHTTRVSRGQRANQKGQRPCVLWFTGLSGSGKSTIANSLEATLFRHGYHGMLLDGDNVRHGLSADLGFSREDRRENIRRLAEVSRLMTEAGLIVATAFISPYRDDRALARKILGEDFIEVHVATSLEECERRDPKGLYARARRGEINGFTGLDAPYEAPESAEIVLDTSRLGVQGAVREILLYLERTGRLLGAAAGSLAVAEDDWEI